MVTRDEWLVDRSSDTEGGGFRPEYVWGWRATPSELVLAELAHDSDAAVRRAVAEQTRRPQLLMALMQDGVDVVRREVAWNALLPPEAGAAGRR